MPNSPGHTTNLEDGLVMRGATLDDADRLADYNTEMHSEPDEPPAWMRAWTHDLITKPHPSMSLDDVILIEDTNTGQIVSSCIYFQQTWSYCGIPVPFGRPELVSTHPDYRNRGLIRKQFDLMHRWGTERGHLVQGITGIPYYYRQFEYELALEIAATRGSSIAEMPKWPESERDERPTVTLRKAERSDVPFMVKARANAIARSLFAPDVTPAELEYQLFDRDELNTVAKTPLVIEDQIGNVIGFATITARPEYHRVDVSSIEFAELPMFRTFTQPFLKTLRAHIELVLGNEQKAIQPVSVQLTDGHPALPFLGKSFTGNDRRYAWYMRAPDLPKLLMLIAPKLEERLLGTVFEGLTGEKVLNFYRTGLSINFDKGQIAEVESTKFPERKKSMASLPDLTFLQLLFGRRSMSEIGHLLVDAYVNSDEDELLLDTLFPKMPSDTHFAIS